MCAYLTLSYEVILDLAIYAIYFTFNTIYNLDYKFSIVKTSYFSKKVSNLLSNNV